MTVASVTLSGIRRILVIPLVLLFAGCTATAGSVPAPLPLAQLRPTPLYFGRYVTPDPAMNPIVPPEKFEGFHVGTDFEVTTDELEQDVPVSAICPGKVIYSGFAEGYGGLVTQQCTLKKKTVTVIYGHLRIEGLPAKGMTLRAGDRIGVLAPARSHDSDGNRKHLHLGIHIGTTVNMRGYVQTEAELAEFMDAQQFWAPITGVHSGSTLLIPYWLTGTGAI